MTGAEGDSSSPCGEGWVHSVETCGAADGPGLRYVVFLSGCPLRCRYCHNPDTWHMRDGHGERADALVADLGRYAGFLKRTGGGLTLSGGEPLVQPAFCRALFRGAKGLGLHTALDTSGFLGTQADTALLADIDLVLLDIKAFNEETYQALTGGSLGPTLAFAERLATLGKPVWLRYVLVPGLTDDRAEIAALAAYAAALGNVERVDVLPYHDLGAHKWALLNKTYRLADTNPPTEVETQRVRDIFDRHLPRAA
ncbi:MAG: pyruvate formate lyase-activating protein [Rhodospirillum sp.]|nr:pyruvate formate lyase-activating protein [Rhodospirillum sp.]MCF8491957.1 pyruvate formate lyase-activating protein [Rhodospirillum sp.]MCF8501036.1 pyruvate formate lyase-activating protein [Rhodospirillum sp.]